MQENAREKTSARLWRFTTCALIVALALVLFRTHSSVPPAGDGAENVVTDVKALYANSADAVFYLRNLNADGELKTSGTGFAISAEGLALTAAHVVQNAESVHAVLSSGEEVEGVAVLSMDREMDTAVLRLPEREEGDYSFLSLEEEIPLSGEAAYAIGYPLKTVKLIVDGIVSAPEADINGTPRMLISTDLASGMSGGPILCSVGTVIGLSSATLRTMNGVNVSPTTVQLWQAVLPYINLPDGTDPPDA